jgi:hypothetical protein
LARSRVASPWSNCRSCSSARPTTSRSDFSARTCSSSAIITSAWIRRSSASATGSGSWPRITRIRSRVATRELGLRAQGADFGAAAQRHRVERVVVRGFGLSHRLIGRRQRLVERALFAVGVREVVVAIDDTSRHAGAGGQAAARDFPGGNGFGVPAAQMADDAQVVRGASGGGMIAVPARGHEGLVQKSAASVRLPVRRAMAPRALSA